MIQNEEKTSYFAALNGRTGFVSFFDEIFFAPDIKRRYIIKGGPGTGKSSFLKRLALRSEENGKTVEYFYCSSDTDSLDGIIIDGRTAVFDGTAPHSYDMELAGACDEIINFGDFWDSRILEESRERLTVLKEKKREAYDEAYLYLASAGAVSDSMRLMTHRCVDIEKMRSAVERIFEKLRLRGAKNGEISVAQTVAMGTHGRVELDTLSRLARNKYFIGEYYGVAQLFLRELLEIARKRGIALRISYDAPDTDTVKELYFEGCNEYFTIVCDKNISKEHLNQINVKRFVNKEALKSERNAYREARKCRETLLALAEDALQRAGDIHAEVEGIYVPTMDFDGLRELCEKISEAIK